MYTTNESVKLKLSTSQYLGMKQLKVGTGLRQEGERSGSPDEGFARI